MRFKCDNISCRENGMFSDPPFTFKAKPEVDERSQCPKCGAWCNKCGQSPRDKHIRVIDLMFTKRGMKPLSQPQYKHLSNYSMVRLKETVVEVRMALEVVE